MFGHFYFRSFFLHAFFRSISSESENALSIPKIFSDSHEEYMFVWTELLGSVLQLQNVNKYKAGLKSRILSTEQNCGLRKQEQFFF